MKHLLSLVDLTANFIIKNKLDCSAIKSEELITTLQYKLIYINYFHRQPISNYTFKDFINKYLDIIGDDSNDPFKMQFVIFELYIFYRFLLQKGLYKEFCKIILEKIPILKKELERNVIPSDLKERFLKLSSIVENIYS